MKLLFAFLLALVLVQSKDKPKKTFNSVQTCTLGVLTDAKWSGNATQLVKDQCLEEDSDVFKSSACKDLNKKYSKIEDPAAPLESGVLSKYRSCAKKCIDDKKVKKDGEAKEIATAILDCSSSVLAMSLLVVGLVAALLF